MKYESGPPIGGIGTGKVELFEDLSFRNITINNNIDTPIERAPGSFFALAADDGCGEKQWKLGSRGFGMDGMTGKMDVRFPHAIWKSASAESCVAVELTAFSPLIPYNLMDSSLPVALFNATVANAGNRDADVCIAFSWQNILNCGGGVIGDWAMVELPPDMQQKRSVYTRWKDVSDNRQQRISAGGYQGIRFYSHNVKNPVSQGEYALLAWGEGMGYSSLEAWESARDSGGFQAAFSSRGFHCCNGEACQEPAAAVALHCRLVPGEHRQMHFALAWHMPGLYAWYLPGVGAKYGHYHENFFGSVAQAAAYALHNRERLFNQSAEIYSLFQKSSLPRWMADSLADGMFPILSSTWFARDGRFSVSEAPTEMGGCMGTLDQRTASHTIYTAFWPELDKTELDMFRLTAGENGSIAHDVGWGDLDSLRKGGSWVDLPSSFVLQVYHHWLWTGDEDFIGRFYAPMLSAVRYLQSAEADVDGDGIPDADSGTTYDAYSWHGATAFVGTLFMAALRAVEQVAMHRGDTGAAGECSAAFQRCRASMLERLWNGKWFDLYHDERKSGGTCGHCCSGQLAGQWMANLLGLGDLFDRDLLETCLGSMNALCLRPVPHAVADVADANGVPQAGIKDWICGWVPYVEAYMAATAYECGRPDIGLAAFRRCRDAVYESDRRPWEARLAYDVNTGKAIWGRWYMTAPAGMAVYWAMLGFGYSLPGKWLRLAPQLASGETRLSAPVFGAAFWGWMDYEIDEGVARLAFTVTRALAEGLKIEQVITSIPRGSALESLQGGTLHSVSVGNVYIGVLLAVTEGAKIDITIMFC